jgi:hypothetical protein
MTTPVLNVWEIVVIATTLASFTVFYSPGFWIGIFNQFNQWIFQTEGWCSAFEKEWEEQIYEHRVFLFWFMFILLWWVMTTQAKDQIRSYLKGWFYIVWGLVGLLMIVSNLYYEQVVLHEAESG